MNQYYIQTNVICILLLQGAYTLLHSKKGFIPARRLAFANLIVCADFLCISDAVAWTVSGQRFPGARVLVEASNMVYYASISWTCYAWLNYVNLRIKGLNYNHRKRMLLSAIPAGIMSLVILANPLTHFLYSIDAANTYARGSGILLHWIVSWGYLLVSCVQVLIELKKARSQTERNSLIQMLWFVVLPSVGALAQMLFYGTTVVQCGVTLSIMMITFGVMNDQILSDPLTGLNNRRALESYVNDQLQKQEYNLSVLMCDIDRFKSINDSYGHTAGDVALKRVAEVLKAACAKSRVPLFLCRYGGDEFVLCSFNSEKQLINDVPSIINEELQSANLGLPGEERLSISIGISNGTCSGVSGMETLLQAADQAMYEEKKRKGLPSSR